MIFQGEYKIRYEIMDERFDDVIRNIRFGPHINMIIDLKEIFRKLYRPDFLYGLGMEDPKGGLIEELSADIINIVAHYRNYFVKFGKQTSLYFLYSEKECDAILEILPEYKQEYYEKYFHSELTEYAAKRLIIDGTLKVLKALLNTIPNVIYIDTSLVDEHNYAKYILSNVSDNDLTIILSNDEAFGTALTKDNHYLLEMRGLQSRLISKNRIVKSLAERSTEISSGLLPLILSMSGSDKTGLVNIPRIGFKTALSITEKLVKDGVISNSNYSNFPLTLDTMPPRIKSYRDQIENNFKVLTGDSVLYSNLTSVKLSFDKPEVVINRRFFLDWNIELFQNHPILIDMILKGEK